MESADRQQHWEHIYQTKTLQEVSWYQPVPHTSLKLIQAAKLPKDAKIIDIGGGDSLLVDHLLELGFTDITVLDISATALERARQRLGAKAELVKWIVSDIVQFVPTEKYAVWHDRAAFHFLTDEKDKNRYLATVSGSLQDNGLLIIGTFSEEGPLKCSGININQYSAQSLSDFFARDFVQQTCHTEDHQTPFQTTQNFLFCSFRHHQSA